MPKKVKIREIEPKKIIVRELKKKEQDRSDFLPRDGSSFGDEGSASAPISADQPREKFVPVSEEVEPLTEETSVREQERIYESRLYEVRGALVADAAEHAIDTDRKPYTPSEEIQGRRVREQHVGRDFAMGPQRGILPENQIHTEQKFREDHRENNNKYGVKEDGDRKKSQHTWERR